MDSSSYKQLKTSRGFSYSYFHSLPKDISKPYILFLHGFPSSSNDWRRQVPFFSSQGYGIIVPDLLGYGGTDKPLDLAAYKFSLMTKDIVEILDAEKVDKPIVVGHDWGSKLTSRLANYYPERFLGFAFLALAYNPPQPQVNLSALLALTKQLVGYELFGYWLFFSEDDASSLIDAHKDSFFSLISPGDPKVWATDMAPSGALRASILADKKYAEPAWLSKEEIELHKQKFPAGALAAPLNWYKIITSGVGAEDDKGIPTDKYQINAPVFFGAAAHDAICVPAVVIRNLQLCPKATIKTFPTGHWVMLEDSDNLNQQLLEWMSDL